jgi:hypothetical protein
VRWGPLIGPVLVGLAAVTISAIVFQAPVPEAVAAKPIPKPVPHYCTFDITQHPQFPMFAPCSKLKAYPAAWARVYEDI